MYSFVARQPILNLHQQPVAYELLFRQGLSNHFPQVSAELATSSLIVDQFLSQPIRQLVDHHLCYINFPYSLLVNGMADALPVDQVVIEILEDAVPDDQLLACVQQLKAKGFRLALDDFTLDPAWERFLPFIDVIKFDVLQTSISAIQRFIRQHRRAGLAFLAEKVETHEQFLTCSRIGCTLFQGYFFSRPEIVQRRSMSENQLTIMQLLREVNQPELDYDQIEQLLNREISLAYKLLRYVNNLRYQHSRYPNAGAITAFRHATMYLGQQEMRRFVSLVSATSGGNHKSSELYRMSLIRARFCELLSQHRHGATDAAEAFLCGLFSLLDAILDQPFSSLLDAIPLSAPIRHALLDQRGELAFYLAFIADYEQENWDRLRRRAEKLQLDETQLIAVYMDATRWADNLLNLSA